MIREINHDPLFLNQPSEPATAEDLPVARDLLETLAAHREECVGMAANMIGVRKNNIVVSMGIINMAMLNPVILDKKRPFDTEEGCLSLPGIRPARRYEKITVEYQDMTMAVHRQTFTGWTAQIIQHEIDHLHGILI